MAHRKFWLFALSFILLMSFFLIGLVIGDRFGILTNMLQKSQVNEDYLAPITETWEIIHREYLNQPIDDEKLVQGALRGMMDSLEDPYSSYMDPQEYQAQSAPLDGEYTGIGAWVDTSGEWLVILSPMPASPSETVGILPGDRVIAVDGEDVAGVDPSVVLNKILGPAGTAVQLTMQRNGEVLEFEVERAVIAIPSVDYRLMDEGIGYIRLYSFGANSLDEVTQALIDLKSQGADRVIFDLRNNSGGFVDSAVEITSIFLAEGNIMIEEWGDGSRNIYQHTGKTLDAESPMVVLINEGSASASEIMAGALQDYGRAKLIGSTTFGKGYIQNWIPLRDEFGAVRITIARWLTPRGRQIQGMGLAPNIAVEITEEDFESQNDAQLLRAVEYLRKLEPAEKVN